MTKRQKKTIHLSGYRCKQHRNLKSILPASTISLNMALDTEPPLEQADGNLDMAIGREPSWDHTDGDPDMVMKKTTTFGTRKRQFAYGDEQRFTLRAHRRWKPLCSLKPLRPFYNTWFCISACTRWFRYSHRHRATLRARRWWFGFVCIAALTRIQTWVEKCSDIG